MESHRVYYLLLLRFLLGFVDLVPASQSCVLQITTAGRHLADAFRHSFKVLRQLDLPECRSRPTGAQTTAAVRRATRVYSHRLSAQARTDRSPQHSSSTQQEHPRALAQPPCPTEWITEALSTAEVTDQAPASRFRSGSLRCRYHGPAAQCTAAATPARAPTRKS